MLKRTILTVGLLLAIGLPATAGYEVGIGGWSRFGHSPDTRRVYVSSSTGNDANDGLSPDRPERTLAAGRADLRNGYPDWLMLKAGDVWDEPLGNWGLSGRSASEYMLITRYGMGARPLLRTGQQSGIVTGWFPSPVSNLAIVGIDFWAHQYAGSQGGAAFLFQAGGANVVIEDCSARNFQNGVVFTGGGSQRWRNVRLRRSVIADSWCLQGTAGNGLYWSECDDSLIEECVFDANGWTAAHPHNGMAPGHSAYIQDGCSNITVRGNIAATTDGIQLRSGGLMEENLFLHTSLPMLFGWGMTPAQNGVSAIVRHNVALDGNDNDANSPLGWGMRFANLRDSLIDSNVIAHNTSGHFARSVVMDADGIGVENVTFSRNVIYNWGGTFQIRGNAQQVRGLRLIGNRIQDLQGRDSLISHDQGGSANPQSIVSSGNQFNRGGSSAWFQANGGKDLAQWKQLVNDTTSNGGVSVFPDPNRTIATYHTSIGGAPTLAAFMTEARRQTKTNWRQPYTARVVNNYIRAGFGVP